MRNSQGPPVPKRAGGRVILARLRAGAKITKQH